MISFFLHAYENQVPTIYHTHKTIRARWQHKTVLVLLFLCCMTPTFLTMAYTDAGLWRELDILFTGFFCVGTASAVLPFFWLPSVWYCTACPSAARA